MFVSCAATGVCHWRLSVTGRGSTLQVLHVLLSLSLSGSLSASISLSQSHSAASCLLFYSRTRSQLSYCGLQAGHTSATGRKHTELIVYQNYYAYPAYVITYKLDAPLPNPYQQPTGYLLRYEDVDADIFPIGVQAEEEPTSGRQVRWRVEDGEARTEPSEPALCWDEVAGTCAGWGGYGRNCDGKGPVLSRTGICRTCEEEMREYIDST